MDSNNNNSNSGNSNQRRNPRGEKKRWHNNKNSKPGGNRNNSKNRNRNSKPIHRNTSLETIFKRYDNLLEMYLTSKRKYFESYQKLNEGSRRKAEGNYSHNLRQLRQFEKNLSPYQAAKLQERSLSGNPTTLYEETHQEELSGVIEEKDTGPERDPHFTMEQELAMATFKDDSEESSGTSEDYLKYKGQT